VYDSFVSSWENTMSADSFQNLIRMVDEDFDSFRERCEKLFESEQERQKQVKLKADELVDVIRDLRIQVKYVLFDLEATRRENAYLRKFLKEGENDDDGP